MTTDADTQEQEPIDFTEVRTRRRQMVIEPELIERMLELPDGVHVWSIRGSSEPFGMVVTIVDAAFTPVDPMCEAPIIGTTRVWDGESKTLAIRYDVEAERG